MSTKNFLSSKKVIVVSILAVVAVSAIFVVSSMMMAQATAQQQQQQRAMMTMPEIKGSVSVANATMGFISENVKVPFVTAANTAQGQVANGTVLGGHLGVVQGYLVYTFFVANTSNQTGHLVVVDAGNGQALYTSEGHTLGSFGPMSGHWGGPWHGGGGWGGPWKGHGFGWGMWH
ncbi:hypothetical protein [Nitrososphaera viennensis]|uniref:PepSY domain-containing protein n=2 Tax=Nitrososphaera viennensis TaxID=1034015 RepID=A0A060HJ79_9ARCH|nr:hypothetical protein [Nitrososphaera viennensis]AIC16629.1 hypothetical protein NVIE_023690 [Nitrososphaera viennensis EN76]UVS68555.1 hypothetical protein NWT39_11670 [Nitrososphaera viennensis]